MKTLFIVQSNFGKGHHARVNAFGDAVDSRLIITKPFNGQGKDTEFFGDTWNDLLFDYLLIIYQYVLGYSNEPLDYYQ